MYNYYRYAGNHTRRENTHNVSFRKVIPPFNNVHNVLWHICSWLSGSRFWEYQILRGNNVLATAQVCPKLPIFPFINSRGIHIGPCKTIKEERGKGFYPLLLQYIIDEHPERKYYMIIDENNISSQKGVEKVNFQLFAVGHKDALGRYVIDQYL